MRRPTDHPGIGRSTPPLPPSGSGGTGPSGAVDQRSRNRRSGKERRARARLELRENERIVILNDRRIPGSRSSIDVILVAPAGVFVIDTKSYKGLVHTKRLGPLSDLGPDQLHVGRRDRSRSISEITLKVEAVRSALGDRPWSAEIPVSPLICLTRAAWGFASPVTVGDVWVGWPRLIADHVSAPVTLDSPMVNEVAFLIANYLPTG